MVLPFFYCVPFYRQGHGLQCMTHGWRTLHNKVRHISQGSREAHDLDYCTSLCPDNVVHQ
jgi:hypothetical protein